MRKSVGPTRLRPNAYAERRGVRRQAVSWAIKVGRISPPGPDGKLDVALADAEWAANTSTTTGGDQGQRGRRRPRAVQASAPAAARAKALPVSRAKARVAKPAASLPPSAPSEAPGEAVAPKPSATSGLVHAKTNREEWQAKIAELDYRARAGELVERAAVAKALTEAGRELREGLFAFVPSVVSLLAAERTPQAMSVVLQEQITEALARLDRRLSTIAGGEAA